MLACLEWVYYSCTCVAMSVDLQPAAVTVKPADAGLSAKMMVRCTYTYLAYSLVRHSRSYLKCNIRYQSSGGGEDVTPRKGPIDLSVLAKQKAAFPCF